MHIYKIVYVNDLFLDFIHLYPNIAHLLYYNEDIEFYKIQRDLFFEPMNEHQNLLILYLKQRDDYIYLNDRYYLNNIITKENIIIKINKYDIEVSENDDKHIIYDVLKQFSKNFYMIIT